jgi:hypothetical protein
VTKWPVLRIRCSQGSCPLVGVEQNRWSNRARYCTGVEDHGGQVFTVSPVVENQSAMRAVACRGWDSIQ